MTPVAVEYVEVISVGVSNVVLALLRQCREWVQNLKQKIVTERSGSLKNKVFFPTSGSSTRTSIVNTADETKKTK